jgi:type VI secretion system protein ImpF
MVYVSDKLNITPSVLDRLLDDSPYLSSDGIPGVRRNPAVRVVADKSIPLSGLIDMDGVNLVTGDRVLVVAQVPNLRNGVYLASSDVWVRVMNPETNELKPGAYWDVSEGNEYGKTQWRFVNTQEIVLETTPVIIERFIPKSQYQSVKELKEVVARDLEAMLNTHREAILKMTDGYLEANRSLVTYGVPDFSTFDVRNPHDRNLVCAILKELINDFETRLKNVDVILTQPREHAQSLHFRLDALLEVHPAREQVVFDAVLQLNTKSYQIEGSQ